MDITKALRKLMGGVRKIFGEPETLVAVLALLLTLFTVAATHKHDRLSVIPKINFDWVTSTTSDKVGLFIENSGAGPAVIEEFTCKDKNVNCDVNKGFLH